MTSDTNPEFAHTFIQGSLKRLEGGWSMKEFWKELQVRGTPVIDPCLDDDRDCLVTFIVRSSKEVESLSIFGGLVDWSEEEGELTRHAGTDLWYCTIRRPKLAMGSYRICADANTDEFKRLKWEDQQDRLRYDAYNPTYYIYTDDPLADPQKRRNRLVSYARLPDAPPEPYLEERDGVEKGTITGVTFRSKTLKNTRKIWIYQSPGDRCPPEERALGVFFDGSSYLTSIPTPQLLDNLLADQKIPPIVAVFVDSVSTDLRRNELQCNDEFVRFLTEELLPHLRETLPFTDKPERTVVGGSSLGGVASVFCGLTVPQRFGLVAAQATSCAGSENGKPARAKILKVLDQVENLPGKYHLDIGARETYVIEGHDRSGLDGHRELVQIIKGKGELVGVLEYQGSHDYIPWRYSLPVALSRLFEGVA